jgi:hypothetical protein
VSGDRAKQGSLRRITRLRQAVTMLSVSGLDWVTGCFDREYSCLQQGWIRFLVSIHA